MRGSVDIASAKGPDRALAGHRWKDGMGGRESNMEGRIGERHRGAKGSIHTKRERERETERDREKERKKKGRERERQREKESG